MSTAIRTEQQPATPAAPSPPAVATRTPTAMDQVELDALARRIGEAVPEQPVVVAAVDGRLVAARSVRTGVTIAERTEDGPVASAALRARAPR